MSSVEERHADLRNRLTDHAENAIREGGLSAVRARDLARKAECSVGAIYSVFSDLNDVIMAVNGRTFRHIGTAVTQALAGHEADPPVDRLIAMSRAYLHFALQHPREWRTLFDLQMSTDQEVPQWYLAELAQLFALIAAPLRELFPTRSMQDLDLLTRTLFSSVHGIVLLGIEKRISGVPVERVEDMIALLLRNVTQQP